MTEASGAATANRLFSVAREVYPHLLRFDESSPMGWGYDFVRPVVISRPHLTRAQAFSIVEAYS